MLYAVLRSLRPAKVVEIGQGFSTRIILAALERNGMETGQAPEFVSIDAYPRFDPKSVSENVRFRCLVREMQSLELEPLLDGCGFLFVDSSHVYKFGSDVAFEFTRLYPMLRPGILLHLHDIYSPYQYPRRWLTNLKYFWNEQYLLETFLMFNQAFEVYLPNQLMVRQSTALAKLVRGLPLAPDFRVPRQFFLPHAKIAISVSGLWPDA